jgi:enoyl-[acyl-carrier protein] reductase II
VILEEKPRMISLFYGEFPELIKAAKDAGIIVAVQVGSVAEARTVWEQGADVVVAQGIEAGGHVRGTIALHPLLSAIIPFSAGRPVLAAGGIVTTADAQAAIVHGAHGVWVGTAFIVTPESQAHPVYRRRVIEAGTDDTEFRRGYSFGWKYGTPHRVIPSRRGRNPSNWVGGGVRTSDKASVGEKIALYCGQGCGHITKERPASEIVAELAAAFHTGIPTGAIQAA